MKDVNRGGVKSCTPAPVVVQAVIFLGASSVSMLVAEEREDELRVLDVLTQPMALA